MSAGLTIEARKAAGYTVLVVAGPLLVGKGDDEFLERLATLREGGALRVAVNLAGVSYVDSAGVAALVRAVQVARREGGRCQLFAASPRVRQLLAMLRLDAALGLVDDEPAALAMLRS